MKFGLFVGFFAVTLALLRGMFWTLERASSNYMLGGTVVRFDQQQVELQPERYARGCYGLYGLQSEASMKVTKERICSPRTVSGSLS
jgi:hypothetical protein